MTGMEALIAFLIIICVAEYLTFRFTLNAYEHMHDHVVEAYKNVTRGYQDIIYVLRNEKEEEE